MNLNREVEVGGRKYRKSGKGKGKPRVRVAGHRKERFEEDLAQNAAELHGTEKPISEFAMKVARGQKAGRKRILRSCNKKLRVLDEAIEIARDEGRDALVRQQESVRRSREKAGGAKETGKLPAVEVEVTRIAKESAKDAKVIKNLGELADAIRAKKISVQRLQLTRDDHRVKSRVSDEQREKSRKRRGAGETKKPNLGPQKKSVASAEEGADKRRGRALRLRGGAASPDYYDEGEDEVEWMRHGGIGRSSEPMPIPRPRAIVSESTFGEDFWAAVEARRREQESAQREREETEARDLEEMEDFENWMGGGEWEDVMDLGADPLLPRTPEPEEYVEMLLRAQEEFWAGPMARDLIPDDGLRAQMRDSAIASVLAEQGRGLSVQLRNSLVRSAQLPDLTEEEIDAI